MTDLISPGGVTGADAAGDDAAGTDAAGAEPVKDGPGPADAPAVADPTVLTPPAGTRCPSCAATLRLGAPWCTLCYTDLRPPAPVPPPAAPPAAPPTGPPTGPPTAPHTTAYGPVALDPLTAPFEALAQPQQEQPPPQAPPPTASWPCASCGAANALSDSACSACGAGFLAGLRESEGPLLVLPVVGELGALSRGQRLGLAAGVVLVVIAVVALLGVLFS